MALLLASATPAFAQVTDDAAPLPELHQAQPLDPCAPVRRVSREFGAAFSSWEPDPAELTGEQIGLVLEPAKPPVAWPEPTADPFLATHLLPTATTNFDREWRRVRDIIILPSCAAVLLGVEPQPPSRALLEAVNRWTNRHVRYRDDAIGDRWADAPATLSQRKGDCEDLAIAKLQLLAALGVPDEAMYLTVVHDLVRRRDHAVLVVRIGSAHWLLDVATDAVLDASRANDYRPILSFSSSRKWLHGR